MTLFSVLLRAQVNLVQRSFLSFPGQTVAGVWHYVDSLNREYALVGTQNGISIVDVTDPSAPDFILQIPGINNLWHEVKVMGKVAYATTEGVDPAGIKDGLQIIDLRYLPDSAPAHYWHGDGILAGRLHKAHTVTVDSGFAYINGHNITAAGLHRGVIIADLNDPLNPHFVGADTLRYCHDSFVRGDTLWASELGSGFSAYDIRDRGNPKFIASQATPYNFNHNSWLSDDSRTLFTTDEQNHAPLASFNVTDLGNIDEPLDKYSVLNIVNTGNSDEVHNVRVFHDFLVNACYGSQITIVDAARPANLIEVGNFPIQSTLAWDADPYLPSGNILATGMTTGLYVLSPTYVRACYLEGNVTDSITGFPLNQVYIKIILTYVNDSSKFTGDYKTGFPVAGTYDVQFVKSGYYTKIISGVSLSSGVLTTLNVQLVPLMTGIDESNLPGKVTVVPNPFSKSAELIIDEKVFSQFHSVNVLVKDVTGRLVRIIPDVHSSRVKISRDGLRSGMYFYEVNTEAGVFTKGKMVVE